MGKRSDEWAEVSQRFQIWPVRVVRFRVEQTFSESVRTAVPMLVERPAI